MTIKQRILAEVQKCREIAESKGYHLPLIPIDLSLTGAVAGKCVHMRLSGKPVKLKFNLAIAERHPEQFLKRTVPHEVAHALQFMRNPNSKPHGHEWDHFCRVLTGSTMPRCHSYDVTGIKRTRKVKKYLFACGCRQHTVSSTIVNRILEGRTYTCKCCKGKIKAV